MKKTEEICFILATSTGYGIEDSLYLGYMLWDCLGLEKIRYRLRPV